MPNAQPSYTAAVLTLRFALRGSSLTSTHLFNVVNRLKEKNVAVTVAASRDNGDLLHIFIRDLLIIFIFLTQSTEIEADLSYIRS